MIPEATRQRIDAVFLLPVAILVVLGIEMVFSASFVVAHNDFGDDTYFLTRHLGWLALGLVGMVLTARMDYHVWNRVAAPLYALTLVLLAVVLLPGLGTTSYGASRWLSLGPLPSFQPSELAKLAMIVYLASWITRVGEDINKLTFGTIPFVIILALSAGLVLVEPDLGTAVVLVLTAALVFLVAGANLLHAMLGAVVACFGLVNFVINAGYKADRIEAFLDPWADPEGIGWHTTQTLLALGSGGLAGLGLGAGRQKYYWVPNAHTDSIYAIVGEEIGFIGTLLVLLLFLFIAWRGLTIACGARDMLGRTLAAGATLLIVSQAMLNMAVVSHVVPNTGVPLPFLSYGGSAMIVSMVAAGIILSVSRTVRPEARGWRAFLFDARPGKDPADAPRPKRSVEHSPTAAPLAAAARRRAARRRSLLSSRSGR
jgi:cell division protein FtsW